MARPESTVYIEQEPRGGVLGKFQGNLLNRIQLAVVYALASILLVMNLFLLDRNRHLQKELSLASARAAQLQLEQEVKVGTSLPPLSGLSKDGELIRLAYSTENQPTIVLVFSPVCGICERNWPIWSRLIESASSGLARVVAVDLTSRADDSYLTMHGLSSLPVISELDPGSILSHRFRFVPQTLLVDRQAVVRGAWTGEMNAADLEELISLAALAKMQGSSLLEE